MERRASFVKLLDEAYKIIESEEFKNMHYSVAYKFNSFHLFEEKILKEEKELSERWNENYNLSRRDIIIKGTEIQKKLARDLDIYYHFLYSFLDQLAKFTVHLYKDKGNLAYRGFKDHKNWFINKNPSFDPEYAQILKEKMEWYDDFKSKRKWITHNISPLVAPVQINGKEVVCFTYNLDKIKNLAWKDINTTNISKVSETLENAGILRVEPIVKELSRNICIFSDRYGRHFLKKIQELKFN